MALNADDVIARLARRPRPRHLSSPGSGIGNPPADQHLQPRPGGTSHSGPGGLGRGRQVAQDASHLPVAGIAQDGHREVALAVHRDGATWPRQRDARERVGPPGPGGEYEGEGGTPVSVGHLGHGEAERKEFAAAGGPSGDPILAGGIGQRGRGVNHEGGFQERHAVRANAAS